MKYFKNNFNRFKDEPGLACLSCAEFAQQRSRLQRGAQPVRFSRTATHTTHTTHHTPHIITSHHHTTAHHHHTVTHQTTTHTIPHTTPHTAHGRESCKGRGVSKSFRCRAKTGQLEMFSRLLSESQGQNLALTLLCVPRSLDSGSNTCRN